MSVLRELVSRFSFDVDKKSVQGYEKTISGMKNSAMRLGAVFGLALSGKSLFNLGLSAKQAASDIERLAGTQFSNFNNQVEEMKKRLDAAQDGVSSLLKKRTVDALGAGFIENFGNSTKSIGMFVDILEVAARQSALTGKTIEDTFSGIEQFIISGEAGGLKGIGGIRLQQQQMLQDINKLLDPSEIGGQAGRQLRAAGLSNVFQKNSEEQINQLKSMDKSLLMFRESSKRLEDLAERGSENVIEAVVNQSSASIDALNQVGTNLGASIVDLKKDAGNIGLFADWIKSFGAEGREKVRLDVEERIKQKSQKVGAEVAMPAGSGMINRGDFKTYQINNSFTINEATDAKAVSAEIEKRMTKTIEDASRQLIPSEDKAQ